MFEYFEGNYTWNMAVNLALGMGASIGDIDDVSRALRPLSRQQDDEASERFFEAWHGLGKKLSRLASQDEAAGFRLSAAAKYRRATIYHIQAERMQAPGFPLREVAFTAALDSFRRFLELSGVECEQCEIPYLDSALPALYIPAQRTNGSADERAPCMVHFDGLDVTKEIIYLLGMPDALAARGVSTLVVDNPGVGEAIRLRGMKNAPEAEVPATACLEYLSTRPDVDPHRIGIIALSLGGYHAPRAAAFESRFACCVAWGAQYDWGATQRRRWETRDLNLPVPHYWDHVCWVFGVQHPEELLEISKRMTLEGILDRIRCPILVAHGENDRQIPVAAAQRVIKECVNSPSAELRVQTVADGGAEHCSVDNVRVLIELVSDWVSKTLRQS